ncbi:MAG TPA: GspE/PulE family protein [Polyangiaceae bacterium]|nr:GspE/PulE family protein [Polyangiaceae bacterium]
MTNSFVPARPDELPIDGDAVVILDELVRRATRFGSSDIHLEPKRDFMQVRFRIDGTMTEQGVVTAEVAPQVISRIKVLSRMDISERRLPQDGQFTLEPGQGGRVHLRASTFPSSLGEKIVLRILLGQSLIPFDRLGMSATMRARVRELVTKPQGFLVTCGPTGSGKTSTLYAFLQLIDTTSVNVVTLEDPIEVELATITQGQTNQRTGFTFAAGLRAILRQDPDVILVGEIRDAETAAIALQASLTGHLVLTTLHTSDTVETIVRLVDLGIEPWIIANALSVVLAQRLVRVVCRNCAEASVLIGDLVEGDELLLEAGTSVVTPKGCAQCRGTGYRGRTGIFETLEMTDDIRELVKNKATSVAYRDLLRARKIPSIRQIGLEKVRAGITTVDEVLRVT